MFYLIVGCVFGIGYLIVGAGVFAIISPGLWLDVCNTTDNYRHRYAWMVGMCYMTMIFWTLYTMKIFKEYLIHRE